jgi:Gly-Xaa carboxypeptidase
LSDIITVLERHPYKPELNDDNPFVGFLSCIVEHGTEVNPWLKFAMAHLNYLRPALVYFLNQILEIKYFLRTSQAVDIIQGGAKGM